MPAENHVSITGRLTADPNISTTNRPSSFRVASYCSGGGDNKRTAFVGVKTFDHDIAATLARGMTVTVEGRFDPWTPQDSKSQVLDVMADEDGISHVDSDGQPAKKAAPAQLPPMAEEDVF